MTAIAFYFDFASPYAYFARHKLVDIAGRHGLPIDYRPIDLRRAKLESGNDGPPTVTIPNKLAFANKDFERWSQRYGVPFATIGGIEGVRELNIGVIYAMRQNKEESYVARVFDHCWGRGGKPDDPAFLADLLDGLDLDAERYKTFVISDAAAVEYEKIFQRAAADRVFGVPTVVIGDELWWGNDRLFMVDEYLQTLNLIDGAAKASSGVGK